MTKVFLSYATEDHHFAELASLKLAESSVALWRDREQLVPGTDWRSGIERGIVECVAMLVALTPSSANSAYVTFEWAYAMGLGKPVLPLKVSDCQVHPRLATIQHFDFSIPGVSPWKALIERISEIEPEAVVGGWAGARIQPVGVLEKVGDDFVEVPYVGEILEYLRSRGFQMISFARVRNVVDKSLTDQKLRALVAEHSDIFKPATLAGGKEGLAVRFP